MTAWESSWRHFVLERGVLNPTPSCLPALRFCTKLQPSSLHSLVVLSSPCQLLPLPTPNSS